MPTIKQKDVFPATDVPWSQGVKVYNNSGSSIASNDIVYASGRRGLHMEVTAADADAAVSSLGNLFVARHEIPDGEYGHVLPWKVEADVDTSAAAVAGQAIYLSGTAGGWSISAPTSGTKARVGTVLEVNATTGAVLIAPALSWADAGGSSLTVADPGTGAAIPLNSSAYIALTTGGSGETNTLAIPQFVGQELVLALDTDGGGNRVVTASQAINATGDTVMTFADAGDAIELTAITVGGALRWRVMGNEGVALS